MDPRDALTAEALRLHERYQHELIERFSVCPWARPARVNGRIHAHVVTEASCAPEDLRPPLAEWASDDAVDVAFAIMPLFDAGPEALYDFAVQVGELSGNAFLGAPFHPEVAPSAGMIHFLRQTPDPTVQLVRRATLEEIRSQDPPHYRDIFKIELRDLQARNAPRTTAASVLAHNKRMLDREGRARIQEIIDDIRDDRERTYAQILPRL